MSLSNVSKGIKEITIDGKTVKSITRNSDSSTLYEKINYLFKDSMTQDTGKWITTSNLLYTNEGVSFISNPSNIRTVSNFNIPVIIEFDVVQCGGSLYCITYPNGKTSGGSGFKIFSDGNLTFYLTADNGSYGTNGSQQYDSPLGHYKVIIDSNLYFSIYKDDIKFNFTDKPNYHPYIRNFQLFFQGFVPSSPTILKNISIREA